MKKYWRIPNNKHIRKYMIYLNMPNYYIDDLLKEKSPFINYLISGTEYVQITNNDFKSENNGYGWNKDTNWCKNQGYEYCGIVELRYDKLKHLNEISKN